MFSRTALQRRILFFSLIVGLPLFHAPAATLTVTSTADVGAGTLRQAIADAAPGGTINFSLPAGSEIGLLSGSLVINKNLTIDGPGAQLLRVRNVNPNIATNRFRISRLPRGGSLLPSPG